MSNNREIFNLLNNNSKTIFSTEEYITLFIDYISSNENYKYLKSYLTNSLKSFEDKIEKWKSFLEVLHDFKREFYKRIDNKLASDWVFLVKNAIVITKDEIIHIESIDDIKLKSFIEKINYHKSSSNIAIFKDIESYVSLRIMNATTEATYLFDLNIVDNETYRDNLINKIINSISI